MDQHDEKLNELLTKYGEDSTAAVAAGAASILTRLNAQHPLVQMICPSLSKFLKMIFGVLEELSKLNPVVYRMAVLDLLHDTGHMDDKQHAAAIADLSNPDSELS